MGTRVPGIPRSSAAVDITPFSRDGKRRLRLVSYLGLVLLVLSPAIRGHDSMPLSSQPMYAHRRSDEAKIATAVARDPAGVLVRLTPWIVGASDDPLLVERSLALAIRNGRASQQCTRIARRARSRGFLANDVIEVIVGFETVNLREFARDSTRPPQLVASARCQATQ